MSKIRTDCASVLCSWSKLTVICALSNRLKWTVPDLRTFLNISYDMTTTSILTRA